MARRTPRTILGSIRTAGSALVLVLSVLTAGCASGGSSGSSDGTVAAGEPKGSSPSTTIVAKSAGGLDCSALEPITQELVVHSAEDDAAEPSFDGDSAAWGSRYDAMIAAVPADRAEPLAEMKAIMNDLGAAYEASAGSIPSGTDPDDAHDDTAALDEIHDRYEAVEPRYLELARWIADQCAGGRVRWACESSGQQAAAKFERVGDALEADDGTSPPEPTASTPEEAVGGVAGTTEAFRTDDQVGWVTLDAEGRATELQTAERSGDGWVEGSTHTCTTSDSTSPDEEFTPIGEAVGD